MRFSWQKLRFSLKKCKQTAVKSKQTAKHIYNQTTVKSKQKAKHANKQLKNVNKKWQNINKKCQKYRFGLRIFEWEMASKMIFGQNMEFVEQFVLRKRKLPYTALEAPIWRYAMLASFFSGKK